MTLASENIAHDNKFPLVSFVTTVLNGEQYLETCVRWMQKVEWPAIEMVILNDGSTDGTISIAHRLAGEDDRIKVYDFGRLGRSRALNQAISLAKGEIIAIQDVDDYCLPQRLKATVPLLVADPSLAFVAGKVVRVTSRDRIDQLTAKLDGGSERITEVQPQDLYMGKNPVVHPSIVFQKKTAQSIGGYVEGTCIEDLEFYFSMLANGRGIVVDKFVNVVYVNPHSSMKSLHNNFQYLRDLIKAQRRARKLFKVKGFNRVYDLMPFYLFLKSVFITVNAKIVDSMQLAVRR